MAFLGRVGKFLGSFHALRGSKITSKRWKSCRTQKLLGHHSNNFMGWQILKQLCRSLMVRRKLTFLRESIPIRKWKLSNCTLCMSWIKWSIIHIRCLPIGKKKHILIPWTHCDPCKTCAVIRRARYLGGEYTITIKQIDYMCISACNSYCKVLGTERNFTRPI